MILVKDPFLPQPPPKLFNFSQTGASSGQACSPSRVSGFDSMCTPRRAAGTGRSRRFDQQLAMRGLPILVIEPRRTVSPVERSAGTSPR